MPCFSGSPWSQPTRHSFNGSPCLLEVETRILKRTGIEKQEIVAEGSRSGPGTGNSDPDFILAFSKKPGPVPVSS